MHSARRAAHTVTRPELIVTETLNERTLLPGHPVQLAAPQRFLDSTPSTVGASIVRSFAGRSSHYLEHEDTAMMSSVITVR